MKEAQLDTTPGGAPRAQAQASRGSGAEPATPHACGEARAAGERADRGALDDAHWMGLALDEARKAAAEDEVPIGAVVVVAGELLARAHNLTRTLQDPTAHAELLAVSAAARASGYQRLLGTTVYTTVEPCFMCAGALVHARVERVVWAVRDPKFGGCASLGRVLDDPRLNHRASFEEGVRAGEARELLRSFFQKTRATAGDP